MAFDINDWAIGSQGVNTFKKKMVSTSSTIEVGDIVAPYRFYRNGRPISREKWDYTSERVGIVITETYSERYKESTLIVKWSNSNQHNTTYLKTQAPAYLVKLS